MVYFPSHRDGGCKEEPVSFESSFLFDSEDLNGLAVEDCQLVAVTADGAEDALCAPIAPLLQRIRRALALDVVFVTLFVGGRPALRQWRTLGDHPLDGSNCDPLELDVAKQLVAARAAPNTRGFLAQPVVAKDGREFGTVCCRRPASESAVDGSALQSVAKLIALAMGQPQPEVAHNVWESSAAAPLGLH
jgi:hypothetical protein